MYKKSSFLLQLHTIKFKLVYTFLSFFPFPNFLFPFSKFNSHEEGLLLQQSPEQGGDSLGRGSSRADGGGSQYNVTKISSVPPPL